MFNTQNNKMLVGYDVVCIAGEKKDTIQQRRFICFSTPTILNLLNSEIKIVTEILKWLILSKL